MQLGRTSLLKLFFFSDPEETKIYLGENLKLMLLMCLKYNHNPHSLEL